MKGVKWICSYIPYLSRLPAERSLWRGGIARLSRTKGKTLTNAIMLPVFVESLAVLGLVFSVLALGIPGADVEHIS